MDSRKVAAIAATGLRRMVRDRTNLLFVFVLPIILVFVLGAANSSYQPRLGLVVEGEGPSTTRLVERMESLDGVEVRWFDDVGNALASLRRDDIDGLLVVPVDHDRALREGRVSTLRFAASPDEGFWLRGTIEGIIGSEAALVRAATVAQQLDAGTFDEGLAVAVGLDRDPGGGVQVLDGEGRPWTEDRREFDQIAGQQLVLFTFITGLTASTALIQSRRLGVSRRMLTTPTAVGTIVVGEAIGRYLTTLLQGVFIVVAAWLLFGVVWGSWAATVTLVVVFALVAAGAAMLFGVLFHNEAQASGVALVAGIVLAALGGSMFPLELFPDGVRIAAHATPHAWANDAFTTVIEGGGGLGDIVTELAVLAAYAVVLLGLAAVLMRSRLSRAAHGQ